MKIFLTVIIIFFNVNLLFSMTVEEAVKIALKNNFQLNAEFFNYKASTDKYKATRSLKMPSFFIDSTYTKLDSPVKLDFSTPLGSETITMTEQDYINFSTGVKLNLYTGGAITGAILKSLHEKEAEKNIFQETKLDVIYNVKVAFINVLEFEAYEKIYKRHLLSLKKHYQDSLEFYNQGIVPYVDVLETNVKLKEAIQNLTEIKNSIKVAKTNLAIIMGKQPSEQVVVSQVKKTYLKKMEIAELYKFAENNRPVLKMIKNKIAAADSLIGIAKAGYKPKLFVSGAYNYSDMQNSIKKKGNFLFQAGIKFQLDWDKSFNEINAAKKKKFSLINSEKDMLSKIYLSVKMAFEDYNTAVSNLQVADSTVKSAKEYYRTIKLKYKEGLTDNSHLLDAEAMLTKALMTKKTFYFKIIKKFFLIERVIGKELQK